MLEWTFPEITALSFAYINTSDRFGPHSFLMYVLYVVLYVVLLYCMLYCMLYWCIVCCIVVLYAVLVYCMLYWCIVCCIGVLYVVLYVVLLYFMYTYQTTKIWFVRSMIFENEGGGAQRYGNKLGNC